MRKVLYILGELEDSDLQWLLDAGVIRKIAPRTPIIEEGTRNESLFIVVDGEFSVMKNGVELARLGSGEVLGDMSLLDSRPPSATVTALQAGTVFVVPKVDLLLKLGRDPHFAARFYRALCIFLANRLTRTDAMIGRGPGTASRQPKEAQVEEHGLDEISPDALSAVALAGARFHWFLQEVRRR
jgi:CRP/FNR family cyclic AMP-dependent transcriptional regulator